MSEYDWRDEKINAIYCRLCGKALCGQTTSHKDGVLFTIPCPCVMDNRDDWKERCKLAENMLNKILSFIDDGSLDRVKIFRLNEKHEAIKTRMELIK